MNQYELRNIFLKSQSFMKPLKFFKLFTCTRDGSKQKKYLIINDCTSKERKLLMLLLLYNK